MRAAVVGVGYGSPCWCWLLVRRAPTSERSRARQLPRRLRVGRTPSDAFTGMLAERHVPANRGSASCSWRSSRQFEALRDGDRSSPRRPRARRRSSAPTGSARGARSARSSRTTPGSRRAPTSSGCAERAGAAGRRAWERRVPSVLSLSTRHAASFGAFTPGVERDYVASTTATVTSTLARSTRPSATSADGRVYGGPPAPRSGLPTTRSTVVFTSTSARPIRCAPAATARHSCVHACPRSRREPATN